MTMRNEISGEKVTLRSLRADFVDVAFAGAKESYGGEFTRWMPWCHENYAIGEMTEFITVAEQNFEAGKEFTFAVFENEIGDFVGFASLNQFNESGAFFNLGYWVRLTKQKRGFASEATRLLARAAFEDLKINRLEIVVACENLASQKAAEKAGATREGVLRSRLSFADGTKDAVMFSFIQRDFAA